MLTQTKLLIGVAVFGGIFFSILCFGVNVSLAASDNIVVSPSIIDESGESRQIIDRIIKIKNNSSVKREMYVVISDMDKSASSTGLGSLLEISRGVISLSPGEEKSLPLKIVTSAKISPGQYHAEIIFAEGSNRWEAEANSKNSLQVKTLVNFLVEEKIVEKLNNIYFRTAKSITIEKKVDFLFRIRNIGNTSQVPKGTIVIYNRNGSEVASLLVNSDKNELLPNNEDGYLSSWNASGKIGKYKARLDVVYGKHGDKNITDTYFFWILPKWLLYVLASIIIFLVLVLIYLFYKISRQGGYVEEEFYNHVIDLKGRIKK